MMDQLYERIALPYPDEKLVIYSDGNNQYEEALNDRYASPCVNYGQSIKIRKQGKVIEKLKRIVIGSPDLSEIETTDIENSNGIFRERIGRLVRKTKCFSKLKCRLEAAVAVFQFYWNFMKEMDGKSTPGMVEGIIDRRITWSVFFHTVIKYD
ncbi:hypothetical protein [Methanoculleus sp. 10]|jgi:hypothetical protein|uniref:hypothetical protein n=1 Tax=Methanoculleus sp. 10 TaxID=430615 RepID=UPI0025EA342F|nr:hypothetical protein [Methanoculleus sp. 10]